MEQAGSNINNIIKVEQGDITLLRLDAIVNAANESLLGGGGVDGAIHRAAGPQLRVYNSTLGGCATGDAKISPGFNLPSKHVISTVGPVWKGGSRNEDELLSNCYTSCLELARQHSCKTIAFPAISTGVYGFPFKRASSIAINTIKAYVEAHPNTFQEILLITFSDQDYTIMLQVMREAAIES